MLRCTDDDSFGPVLGPGSGCPGFDFTLLFEEAFFSIAPAALLLLIVPFRLHAIWQKPRHTKWTTLRLAKSAAYAVTNIFQLSLVALWVSKVETRTRLTLPSCIVSLLSIIVLWTLSDVEHCSSVAPSATAQSFLLLTCLLDAARVRTQWLLTDNHAIAVVFTVTFSMRSLLLVLESFVERTAEEAAWQNISPETRAGIFGRSLFLWLLPLLRLGYKRDLAMQDLYPIDGDLSSEKVFEQLRTVWEKCNQQRKHSLALAALRTFSPQFVLILVPRMALVGFSLAQPFLVQATLNYIDNCLVVPVGHGYGLTGAYALTYIGIAVSWAWYWSWTFRLVTKIRGSLVALIYQGMLGLRAESDKAAAGQAHMSNDVDRIALLAWCVAIIANIVQVALAIWILAFQLGAVCIAPIIVGLICSVASGRVGKLIPPRQKQWMEAIQTRVGITTSVVNSIKGVKVSGLTEHMSERIQGLRAFELDESKRMRRVQIGIILLGQLPAIMTPAVTFAAFAIAQQVGGGDQFGIVKAFTSLSLLSILIGPIAELVTSFTNLNSVVSCLDRIQNFLLSERREDFRETADMVTGSSDGTSSDHLRWMPNMAASKKGCQGMEPVIVVERGHFGWQKDTSALADISLAIMPSTLTMIIGPVGVGKSTLLKTLLGETYRLSGMVQLNSNGEIAFCDQDPWMLNQSIKDNIIGVRPLEGGLYDRVVDACQLHEDFNDLPEGDGLIVGSQGAAPSGGQKQRVALARAAYSDKQIVVLDDSLRGLDAKTEARCFHRLLAKNGLLRKGGRTCTGCLMLTRSLFWAKAAVSSRVERSMTFVQLMDVSRLRLIQQSGSDESEDISSQSEPKVPKPTAESGSEPGATTKPDTEDSKRGHYKSNILVHYAKSMGFMGFWMFLGLVVAQIGCRTLQPLWLKFWVAANTADPNEPIGLWIGVYIALGAGVLIFLGLEVSWYLLKVVPRSAKSLHRGLLRAAMGAPLGFFVNTDTGEIINRFSQDMTLVDLALPIAFMLTSEHILAAISEVILTCIESGYLAVVIPLLAGVLLLLQRIYLRTSRQMRLLELEAKSPLYSHFIASFDGLATVRAFNWTRQLHEDNLARLDRSQAPVYLLYRLQRWLTVVLDLVVAGLAVLLVGLAVVLRDSVDPALLGVALVNVIGFGSTLSYLLTAWTNLETSLGAVTRIVQFERDTPREYNAPSQPPPPVNWPTRGAIELAGVSATHGARTVLHDISLSIPPGAKVALVERSGSGKSTLLGLLLRLQDPTAGLVAVDGLDVTHVAPGILRSALVALPQDPLFLPGDGGSVRDSLDPLSAATDGACEAALERTGLGALVRAHSDGLRAPLAVDALSAGQRQLFGLARALLRPGPVLLLDEATSCLDQETEEGVLELLGVEFAGWTVLMVAHRLRTVLGFDMVVILRDGRVVEVGPPRELLDKGGAFRSLWDVQEA